MKFATALVGAGALCVSTDAFVPAAVPAGSSFVAQSSVLASSPVSAAPARGGEVVMSLGGGGSKKGGPPKSMSSKITNIFRGGRSKG